jgi:uncharacterized protein (TIGR00299 family) protein
MATPFAIIDPAAGISGDMLLGALVDAGVPAALLEELPARLGYPDLGVRVSRVRRCGVMATRVTVGGLDDHRHQEHNGAPTHAGPHHHPPAILERIAGAPLSAAVRERAAAAFQLLTSVEAGVHGTTPESVVLHEVGAADAVVDIVGALVGFEFLGIDRISLLPVALGNGWVRSAHGMLPVPAPATLRLLEGITVVADGVVTGEATTPTGAVLLRLLHNYPLPARWRPRHTGWGAGSRDPADYPNTLRLVLAETANEAGQVVTLSSDMDDLSPEYIEPLREALVAAGALDVVVWGTQMKKGRPGLRVEVTCDTHSTDAVTEAFFLHSTTAGIRRGILERVTLPRREIQVPAADGLLIPVKVLETPAGPRVKPEYEALRAAAERLGRPAIDIARDIERRARTLVASDHPAEHHH